MIQPSQVWLAIEPVDMRLGIDGLSLRVQQALDRAPCDGAAIAFSNRRRNRMKLLAWDGTGVWLPRFCSMPFNLAANRGPSFHRTCAKSRAGR